MIDDNMVIVSCHRGIRSQARFWSDFWIMEMIARQAHSIWIFETSIAFKCAIPLWSAKSLDSGGSLAFTSTENAMNILPYGLGISPPTHALPVAWVKDSSKCSLTQPGGGGIQSGDTARLLLGPAYVLVKFCSKIEWAVLWMTYSGSTGLYSKILLFLFFRRYQHS